MADIQSATAEVKRGKKERQKKKPQGKNIMSVSATPGGHKNYNDDAVTVLNTYYYPSSQQVLKMRTAMYLHL